MEHGLMTLQFSALKDGVTIHIGVGYPQTFPMLLLLHETIMSLGNNLGTCCCRQDFGSYTAHLAVAVLGSQIWFSSTFHLWTYFFHFSCNPPRPESPGSRDSNRTKYVWIYSLEAELQRCRSCWVFCLHILWNSPFSLSFESHGTYYGSLERSWREESNGVKGEGIGPVFVENVRS